MKLAVASVSTLALAGCVWNVGAVAVPPVGVPGVVVGVLGVLGVLGAPAVGGLLVPVSGAPASPPPPPQAATRMATAARMAAFWCLVETMGSSLESNAQAEVRGTASAVLWAASIGTGHVRNS